MRGRAGDMERKRIVAEVAPSHFGDLAASRARRATSACVAFLRSATHTTLVLFVFRFVLIQVLLASLYSFSMIYFGH